MELLKLSLTTLMAFGSVAVVLYVRGKPFEYQVYRSSVVYGTLGKFLLCVAVYVMVPAINQGSDAALYYLPQTLELLSGKIPYRDFDTSYSILFHVLLAPGVLLWKSVGSVALTMLLLESVMLWVYVRRCERRRWMKGWRVAFLYAFSPISVYWITLTGYNSVIIALSTMLALVMAEERRDISSGIVAALGLLFSKFLILASWPGIVLSYARGRFKRLVPLLVCVSVLALLAAFQIDVLYPVKAQFLKETSGNFWFLIATVVGGFRENPLWSRLPFVTFMPIFAAMFLLYLQKNKDPGQRGFDLASAFIAATYLLFMIFSRKTYTFYMSMSLIFVIHALHLDDRFFLRRLIPLSVLGATTTIELYLYEEVKATRPFVWNVEAIELFVVDLVIVGCYAYWLLVCLGAFLSTRPGERSGATPEVADGRLHSGGDVPSDGPTGGRGRMEMAGAGRRGV